MKTFTYKGSTITIEAANVESEQHIRFNWTYTPIGKDPEWDSTYGAETTQTKAELRAMAMADYDLRSIEKAAISVANNKGWWLINLDFKSDGTLYVICKTAKHSEYAVHLLCHSEANGYYFEQGSYTHSEAQAYSKMFSRMK